MHPVLEMSMNIRETFNSRKQIKAHRRVNANLFLAYYAKNWLDPREGVEVHAGNPRSNPFFVPEGGKSGL